VSKQQITNLAVIGVVVVVVAGVAWYKSNASSAGPAVQSGELCPEQPNTDGGGGPAPVQTAGLPRVVDLGADKCKACKEMAPILEELKREYAGRVVVEFIDVWKNPDAAKPYNIRLIPTQVFFDREGKEVWRHEGFLPKADFLKKFAELGVDQS